MIPSYDVIVASASRPHLLARTLSTLFEHVDLMPRHVYLHDDAAFEDRKAWRRQGVIDVLMRHVPSEGLPLPAWNAMYDDPAVGHGPSLAWLLAQTTWSKYALYTQDDFETLRTLPIAEALDLMERHDLNQIRFNKRATMEFKDTAQGPWFKKEFTFGNRILTVSDHWYFQTSLWRLSAIRPIIAHWMELAKSNPFTMKRFSRWCEPLINQVLDSHPYVPDVTPAWHQRDQDVRATVQRTFIWGPIGEDRFVQHIGNVRADWAGTHPREEGA